jgi:hypothetical protein
VFAGAVALLPSCSSPDLTASGSGEPITRNGPGQGLPPVAGLVRVANRVWLTWNNRRGCFAHDSSYAAVASFPALLFKGLLPPKPSRYPYPFGGQHPLPPKPVAQAQRLTSGNGIIAGRPRIGGGNQAISSELAIHFGALSQAAAQAHADCQQ